MENFEITSADQYGSEYSRLGQALGVAGATPAAGELEFLRAVTTPGRFDFGMLLPRDIFFAAGVTSILGPRLAIEIGTASGSSAAILGKMIALRQAEAGSIATEPLLHTIDKKAEYVVDHTKPVGFAIGLMTPELRERIAVHPLQDSSHCRRLIDDRRLTFAFIDGNHQHPWPLLDVLQIQQVMEQGWILLHDIDLPGMIERAVAAGQNLDLDVASGAQHVFDFWPEEKIRSGNIGAIKIPADRRSLGPFLARLRKLPCEVSSGSWTKRWRSIDSLIQSSAPRPWFSRRA